jgi:hypothetical protein
MALFGRSRDINLFTTVTRELMGDIITQQCSFYKLRLAQTTFNLYGEAAGGKYYDGPILFNCLINREDQAYEENEFGVDFNWIINFYFLREDLVDAQLVPEIGDLILYQNGYYEIDSITANQYLFGKNPDFPNESNPLNPGLSDFGSNYSVLCKAHYEPADKFGITKERL